MQHKLKAVALSNLSDFFLTVGNGNTFETLRSLIQEVESGVSLEKIFERIIGNARQKANEQPDAFSRLRSWAMIAGETHLDDDYDNAQDILHEIHSSNQRAKAKTLLVKALAKMGHLEDAKVLAEHIKNAYWRAEAFLKIYKITGDEDSFAKAKLAAKEVQSEEAQDEISAQILAAKHTK